MAMDGYKLIKVHTDKQRSYEGLDLLLARLQTQYDLGDTHINRDGETLKAYLRTIDVDRFKRAINELVNEHSPAKVSATKDTLQRLLAEIEGIRSYGIKAGKRIYVDYNKERKVTGRKEKEAKRGPYFYAQDADFSKDNTELPKKFINKIICADSEQYLKNFPDNCIDLIFTSPPYNFGLGYDMTKDGVAWQIYLDKLFRVFTECIRVLKYGGRVIVNVQPLFSDYIPLHHLISNFFIKHKLIWKGEILWEKNNYNCKYTAWGSWKSPSSPYLKYTWEFLEIFAKGSLKKKGAKKNADITAEEFKKWVVAKWNVAPERNMKRYEHPAMFPEELAYRVIRLFSFKGDIVLDPFNGVGTTTAVADKLNRQYVGIDVSKEYCKKARMRHYEQTRQKSLIS